MKWVLLLLALVLGSSSSSAQMVFRWPWPGNLSPVYIDTLCIGTEGTAVGGSQKFYRRYIPGIDSTWVIQVEPVGSRLTNSGALRSIPIHTGIAGWGNPAQAMQGAAVQDSLYLLYNSSIATHTGLCVQVLFLRPFRPGESPPNWLRLR